MTTKNDQSHVVGSTQPEEQRATASEAGGDPNAVSEVLTRAAELIETRGWYQGWFACDANGDPVLPDASSYAASTSPRACRFCALGAMRAIAGRDDAAWHNAAAALNEVVRRDGYMSVDDFNDSVTRTQAEVISALREAAALALAEGR